MRGYYPLDGLFIHVLRTKLAGGVLWHVKLPKQAMLALFIFHTFDVTEMSFRGSTLGWTWVSHVIKFWFVTRSGPNFVTVVTPTHYNHECLQAKVWICNIQTSSHKLFQDFFIAFDARADIRKYKRIDRKRHRRSILDNTWYRHIWPDTGQDKTRQIRQMDREKTWDELDYLTRVCWQEFASKSDKGNFTNFATFTVQRWFLRPPTGRMHLLCVNISLKTGVKRNSRSWLHFLLSSNVGMGCSFKEENVNLRGCVKQKE